uniref:Uncharacterized protein n=1 Tax=Caenorhabditis japonica TaxID=281687 RepID=A0A8R1ITL6_CAEJA
MPDDPNDKEQESKDFDFITAFSRRNSLPVPTKAHRHPCNARTRPLKLHFNSKEERDKFIVGFHRVKASDSTFSAISSKPRCRRDLTPPELETLRKSRKFVYDENSKAKKSLYIIHGIYYKHNSNPRPFV